MAVGYMQTISGLTLRQRQVLGELLNGLAEKQIAARLGISHHTVHAHVKSIYQRLNVSSRAELLVRCLNHRAEPY